jgi:hypothetical protein
MQWITLLSTLLGALVGVGSTILVERTRFSRDRRYHREEIRREAYASFLTELSRAYESLWSLGWGEYLMDQPRAAAARSILRDSGVYQARQRVVILAPQTVSAACNDAFDKLKAVRDALGAGGELESPEFRSADNAYKASVRDLLQVIRSDLQIQDPMQLPAETPR